MVNRADALVAFGEAFEAKKKLPLKSGSLEVVVSPGGRSAWAFDMINLDGNTVAAAAILENADDIWQVTTISLAQMHSGKDIKAELAKDAVVPPGASAPGKIADDAEDAVDKFKKGLVDQTPWGADLSARSDAIVVGPTNGDIVKGKKDIKKAWKKRVDAKTRAAISGEVVAGTTADGQLAWVSAPLTRVVDDDPPMPLRAFAVFERAGDDWKMIMLHEAVALDQPGAGASFKKTLPPAPGAEPPEEPKPDPKVKKKPPKSKPKAKPQAKKKKKPADDDE